MKANALLADGRDRQDEITLAIAELQEQVVTDAVNDDQLLAIDKKEGTLYIKIGDAGLEMIANAVIGQLAFNPQQMTDGDVLVYDSESKTWEGLTPTQITVVTAVQYDTTTKQVQIKTRTANVLAAGSESGWTMVTGGQAAECEDE